MELEKLSYEIFSILENKFLSNSISISQTPVTSSSQTTPIHDHFNHSSAGGKVRILSIDAVDDVMVVATAVSHLESSLRSLSGSPAATIADFFDAAAGSGSGGVLAAMLFTKRPSDNKPMFSAEEALAFLSGKSTIQRPKSGIMGIFGKRNHNKKDKLHNVFKDEATLKETIKPLLIPCYDLVTKSPFVFSRSDAVESDAFNFKMNDVCGATCAEKTVGMESVDGRTRIAAIGNGIVMSNPTAAVITHVLNNKTEFPFVNGIDDLLVVSFGNGVDETSTGYEDGTPSAKEMLRIAGNSEADAVDQSIAMAFGKNRGKNYVRIQGNDIFNVKDLGRGKDVSVHRLSNADRMLVQNNVESVLFSGKKISTLSNGEKLELFGKEIVEEEERRTLSPISVVKVKQTAMVMTPPRYSSSTAASFSSSFDENQSNMWMRLDSPMTSERLNHGPKDVSNYQPGRWIQLHCKLCSTWRQFLLKTIYFILLFVFSVFVANLLYFLFYNLPNDLDSSLLQNLRYLS